MTNLSRKIILDIDPGVGDILSLCVALYESRLNVQGITVCGGHVAPERALRMVQGVVELFDPPRLPRFGLGRELEPCFFPNARDFWSITGLEESEQKTVGSAVIHPSEKILADLIRSNPNEVTILSFGPLTNIARVFARENDLAAKVHRLVMVGGCVTEPGNATSVAEYNFYRDPFSARQVFQMPMAKTLVPLDVTNRLLLDYSFLDLLPPKTTHIGHFFHKVLPQAFFLHRQHLGVEGVFIPGLIALMTLLHPQLFQCKMMLADVETQGNLTRGMTVFDRRHTQSSKANVDVVLRMDVAEVRQEVEQFWRNFEENH